MHEKQDCTNDILLPSLNYCKKIILGDITDWGIFRPVSILPILSYHFIKIIMRYPRLGEYQDWSEYFLVWGISCYICYKEVTQNEEY